MNAKAIRARLVAARKLIEIPERWTRLEYFRKARGFKAYCASAAIYTAVGQCVDAETVKAHLKATIERHTGKTRDVAAWNDHPDRTHPEVMQMFAWAIAEADSAEVTS